MSFFPEGAYSQNPLSKHIRKMNEPSKKAMYAAAKKGLIKRGTWDGCAWNAAGKEVDANRNISNQYAAADIFGTTPAIVTNFIRAWDSIEGTDTYATSLLISALEEVGISCPADTKRLTRVIKGFAYKSADTKFKEELDKVSNISDIPGIDLETVDTVKVLLNA